MRGFGLLLLAAVLGSCATPAPTDSAPVEENTVEITPSADSLKPFTMLFYNVENLFDTQNDPLTNDDDFTPAGDMRWTEERYEQKLRQLAAAISFTGEDLPLIIGLAEVENRAVVQDLAEGSGLAAARYQVVHKDSPDERGIDVALLVAPAFEVKRTEFLAVELGTDKTRDILHAHIADKRGGVWHVFVNHWPSRGEGERESAPKRMKAARTLRQRVDQVLAVDPNARIVIMGDLNDEPLDASLKEGLLTDELVSDDHGADLYDLVGMDRTPPLGSISYNSQWQYFDHIIVSRSLVWPEGQGPRAVSAASLDDARLIFHHPRYGDQPNRTFSGRNQYHPNGFSDHLPVVLRVGE